MAHGGLPGKERWFEEFEATARQPRLNSHLNASEVALTAITADGRLLTHAPASYGRRAATSPSAPHEFLASPLLLPPPLKPPGQLPPSRDNG